MAPRARSRNRCAVLCDVLLSPERNCALDVFVCRRCASVVCAFAVRYVGTMAQDVEVEPFLKFIAS